METIPMSATKAQQTRLVLPPDTNHMGTIFGGVVMACIDELAAVAAMKHAGSLVVTASIDSIDFVSPAVSGDILEMEAIVTSTGRTSMEVYVQVHSLNARTGERHLTTESFVTMVAMGDDGRPTPVASVYPETAEEEKLFQSAAARRAGRKERVKWKNAHSDNAPSNDSSELF